MSSTIRSFFSNFHSFFLLLLHLGCFTFSSHHHRRRHGSSISLLKKKLTPTKPSLFSFLKNLFTPSKNPSNHHIVTTNPPPPSIPSPSSSTLSLRSNSPPITVVEPPPNHHHQTTTTTTPIHPCTICGEIFPTPTLLQNHHSTNHPISDLSPEGENIVQLIFKTGWPEKAKPFTIHNILKIHNGPKTLARFEEYREWVKSRAAKMIKIRDERCMADGNELLRFHCTTFICGLDSGLCGHQYCSACGIIRAGFSPKMDGISTMPTGWGAHRAVPEDLEEEFGFMHVKRAVLVCRVVAGRVGCDPVLADKEDPGFDSLAGPGSGGGFDDELLVFDPKAVLPCFVIVYTV